MRKIIFVIIFISIFTAFSASQQDTDGTHADSSSVVKHNLSGQVDSLVKAILKKSDNSDPDSIDAISRNEYHSHTIIDTTGTEFYKYSRPRWNITDMGIETSTGIGGGLLGALVGAMIGSMFHVPGDKSESGNDVAETAVYIGLGIGHFFGSSIGVVVGGEKFRKVKGSRVLAFLGSAIGETAGIIVLWKNRNPYSTIGLAILPALLATILYNISD